MLNALGQNGYDVAAVLVGAAALLGAAVSLLMEQLLSGWWPHGVPGHMEGACSQNQQSRTKQQAKRT